MNRIAILAFLSLVSVLATGCATEDRRGEFMTVYARALAWSPDSKEIVSIGVSSLVVHDATTLKPLVTRKSAQRESRTQAPAASIEFSPDGTTVATAGFDGGVVLWDALTWLPKVRLKGADGDTTLAFTPDGSQLIAAGPDSALMVFDVASGTRLATIVDAPSGSMSVAVSPDGKLLASGEINKQVRLWKLPSRELFTTIQGYFAPVLSVAFSPDGKLLASTAGGREARLLNLDNPTHVLTLVDPAKPTAEQRSAEIVVGILSMAGMVRTIQITGAPGSAPVTGFKYPEWPAFNCPLAFSPDGKFLALNRFSHEMSASYHIEVYDVATGVRVSRYNGAGSPLAFSPDGRRLAASGPLGIILLDPLTGRKVTVDQ